MSQSLSVDSINLEESDLETEEIIKNIINRGFSGKTMFNETDYISFRKKVVQLIGNYLLIT